MTVFDAQGAFLPDLGTTNLRAATVRGAGVSTAAQGVVFGMQMIGTMVLARVLAPADFGIVTMVMAFSLLLTSFGLNGFTEAVIQRHEMNRGLASNLFWINISIGTLFTLVLASTGSLMASFFHEPRVAPAAVALSANNFFTSLTILHLALLKRAMRFSAVSAIDVVARCISIGVSVALGVAGWGYWALVIGTIAHPFTTTIGAWSVCQWRPSRPRRVPGTGSTVRFAMNVYSHFVLSYTGSNSDNLLVGWRFHAQALAFYKKAYDLFLLPATQLLGPLGSVAIASLSKLRGDRSEFRRHFLGAVSILAFLGMAVGADLTLVGPDLVRMLLGSQWDEAGRIFRFFGPGIGAMLIYGMHGWIHISIGKAERWFRWGLIELSVTLGLFMICLHWGPVGIASAWTASFWLLFLPAFWYAGRPIQLGIRDTLSAMWKFTVSALAAGLIVALAIPSIASAISLSGLAGIASRAVVVSVLFGVLYTLLVIILHGGLAPIQQVVRLVREILPKRTSRKSAPAEAVFRETGAEVSPAADR